MSVQYKRRIFLIFSKKHRDLIKDLDTWLSDVIIDHIRRDELISQAWKIRDNIYNEIIKNEKQKNRNTTTNYTNK